MEHHFIGGKQVNPREWREYSSSQRAKDDLAKTKKKTDSPIVVRSGEKK
jgi:hypothetical protein